MLVGEPSTLSASIAASNSPKIVGANPCKASKAAASVGGHLNNELTSATGCSAGVADLGSNTRSGLDRRFAVFQQLCTAREPSGRAWARLCEEGMIRAPAAVAT